MKKNYKKVYSFIQISIDVIILNCLSLSFFVVFFYYYSESSRKPFSSMSAFFFVLFCTCIYVYKCYIDKSNTWLVCTVIQNNHVMILLSCRWPQDSGICVVTLLWSPANSSSLWHVFCLCVCFLSQNVKADFSNKSFKLNWIEQHCFFKCWLAVCDLNLRDLGWSHIQKRLLFSFE